MKIKDLILELQKQSPESLVVVDGYEGGVEEVKTVRQVTIALNVSEEWYYGPHEIDRLDEYPEALKAQAVLLR
jgi:hypothetical protein